MKIAVKRANTIIDEEGNVVGQDAGPTLMRRFLRIFPGSQVIGNEYREGNGFEVVPLAGVNPADTVIINMDVLDSSGIWNTLYELSGISPKIMNFVWWQMARLKNIEQQAPAALSCGLFPTFANSSHTAEEIRELVGKLTVPQISSRLSLGWVNLGFRLDHVQEREATPVPVVLYPAIYLSASKRPDLFMEIVERVHKRTPLEVEMRLSANSLVSEKAMRISQMNWVWVGPMTATRSSYWEALAHTTAFLATASQESYGLSYVEAMGAGAIGVFPDEEWAHALLPAGYPFVYSSKAEAEELLYRAVTDPEGCRAELDATAGGSFTEWISKTHSDATFDREVMDFVQALFGD